MLGLRKLKLPLVEEMWGEEGQEAGEEVGEAPAPDWELVKPALLLILGKGEAQAGVEVGEAPLWELVKPALLMLDKGEA